MSRILRPIAPLLACALAVLAFGAASAAAQTPAAGTSAATSVTNTSAQLNGVLTTGGVDAYWEFEYGTTTSYGHTAPAPPGVVPGGFSSADVSAVINNLSPGQTYHFRLVMLSVYPAPSYYAVPQVGGDETFTTTKTGKVTLTNTQLTVTNNLVAILLQCLSNKTCAGTLSITTIIQVLEHGKRASAVTASKRVNKKLACVSKGFTIRAGKKATIKGKLSAKCRKLLTSAKRHKLAGKLTVTFHTGQPKITKNITLVQKKKKK